MTNINLPPLPTGVKYVGSPDGPEETQPPDEDAPVTLLVAKYTIDDLRVDLTWTIGHPMGEFREPNRLFVDFDSARFAASNSRETGDPGRPSKAFDGVTSSLLRRIPMAHARALMRDRHERLAVETIRSELTPLPGRVENETDYIHIACAYVSLGAASVEPLKRLYDWSGESVETWSARLKRARARGILEGTGRNARISGAYLETSNTLRAELRAKKDKKNGD